MFKVNEYFGGNVKSIALKRFSARNRRRYRPGEYEFGT